MSAQPTPEPEAPVGAGPEQLLTLEELTTRVGMSVRNVRFYTSKGLVPPPIRRGRSGYYSADHVARLELVQELQGHGFTLAAIERYVAGLPDDATPEEVALRRTMLAPWQAEPPTRMTRADLEQRVDRPLTDDELDTLVAIGVVFHDDDPGVLKVALSQLSVGLGLIDLGFPREAALASKALYERHGRELARELNDVFHTMVWPRYRDSGASPDTVRELVERLKPLSIASLVTAYEVGMDQTNRETIERRTRG